MMLPPADYRPKRPMIRFAIELTTPHDLYETNGSIMLTGDDRSLEELAAAAAIEVDKALDRLVRRATLAEGVDQQGGEQA